MPKFWTPPPTFVDDTKLRVGELDTYARDNLEVLRNRPGVMTQWIGNEFEPPELKAPRATWTPVQFNGERRDTGSLHDSDSNNTRVYVPAGASGLWLLTATLNLGAFYTPAPPGFPGGFRQAALRVNGSRYLGVANVKPPASDFGVTLPIAVMFPLTAGDYFEVVVNHDATEELQISNNQGISPELRTQFLCELRAGSVPEWQGLKTWADDEVLTAADLNDQLRDNASFLRYRPAAVLEHPAVESIPNNAWTSASLAVLRGQNGVWNGTANTLTVPAGCGGLYLIGLATRITGHNGGDDKGAAILHNGTTRVLVKNFVGTTTDVWPDLVAMRLFRLAAGDTLRLQHFQNSGAAVNSQPPPLLSACWMAP